MPRSRINGNFIDRTFFNCSQYLVGNNSNNFRRKKGIYLLQRWCDLILFSWFFLALVKLGCGIEPSIDPFNRVSSIDAISDASIVNLSIKRKIRPVGFFVLRVLGLTRMVGTTNIHFVRTLDTHKTIKDR
ncbi:hypothetical protein LUZ61_022936 [Rhynchospora tenuis]|uniref:Uncharacterized protein n=1 Tax=Rhynchospora tenuis TaxID=198213 RepID=A0AAD5YZA1_9POAL|nr:hypothetical protein LUZ61_022936 [Rhynchospora tenuis]